MDIKNLVDKLVDKIAKKDEFTFSPKNYVKMHKKPRADYLSALGLYRWKYLGVLINPWLP